tara:strand:+ start:1672 stop:2073 length:402 start_codon:yes stop_codon:yes gene_type:complete
MSICPVLTIKETAKYLKVSVESLRNLIKRGEIPVSRVGAQYRFRKDILDIWLKEAALASYKGNLALYDLEFRKRVLKVVQNSTLESIDKDRFAKVIHQLIEDRVTASELKDSPDSGDDYTAQFIPSHFEEELL